MVECFVFLRPLGLRLAEQLQGKVLTGVLYKEEKPHYTEEYAKVIERAKAAK